MICLSTSLCILFSVFTLPLGKGKWVSVDIEGSHKENKTLKEEESAQSSNTNDHMFYP